MTVGPQNQLGKVGTLILVSRCVAELARFEAITQRWDVVSVLCAQNLPEALVSRLIHQNKAHVAALDPYAGKFVLNLPREDLQKTSGLFVVGLDVHALQKAALPPYHGDFVCMTTTGAGKGQISMLRRRLTSLRVLPLNVPDEVRFELRNFLSRAHTAAAYPTHCPLVSWR